MPSSEGHKNLRPLEKGTERAKRISAMGGQRTKEKVKRAKTFKEMFEAALQIEDENGLTSAQKGVLALMAQYEKGNIKAHEYIRDTIGEKPVERHEIEAPNIKFTMGDDLSG